MPNKNKKIFSLLDKIIDIEEIVVPKEYKQIWNDVSLATQKRKAKNYDLSEEQTNKALQQLCKRPYYLTTIAEIFNVNSIAEVGTAEGLQFFSFARYVKNKNGHVWSCDIKDVRNKEYCEIYKNNTTFCLGDSKNLSSKIDTKIDLFYIDGAHGYGDVVRDVVNLKEKQSENPIWIFDDFDIRFGCYKDIERLCNMGKPHKVYRVGNTASGYPNHQVIIQGKF